MGYYPTPLDVARRIRSFLSYPDERVALLDPCCGEGQALKAQAEGANAETYGIELDEYRAEEAKSILDHVLKCSYEDTRISNNAFSCLFLNPPYDWVGRGDDDERSERTEHAFLKGTVRYVQPEGVLVYVVPQHRVVEPVVKLLSYRFEDFNAYRFPEEEYEPFRQVVVFGVKKQKPRIVGGDFDRLLSIPREELGQLPYLDTPMYALPPSGLVQLFRSTIIDEAELAHELEQSRLWKDLARYGGNSDGHMGRPPLPLHAGHLGLLLASGHLDGVVGEGEDRHVVRGKVEKLTHTYQEYEGDKLVEREVERYQVSIKVLKRDGEIITLM